MSIGKKSFRVTVVTVVFNCVGDIEETITSVLKQTYDNIEYLVIDGGSVDGTVKIIEQYQNKINKWVSEPDGGVFYGMNKGLDLANGDFILFMNAGDTFCNNNTVESMVKQMHNEDEIYYGNAIFSDKLNNSKKLRAEVFTKYRLAEVNFCHQTVFYPKNVFKLNSYDTNYKLYADWMYNIKLFLKVKFNYVNINIANYDTNGISANNEDPLFRSKRINIIREFLGIEVVLYLILNKINKEFKAIFKKKVNV